jgi:hypothetical protein
MTKTESHNFNNFDQRASLPKLMFLAVISIALCSFGPLAVFAPVPLILAFLLYGRMTTLFLGGVSTAILWGISIKFTQLPLLLVGMYLMALLYAVLIAEVIFRNIDPVKGLMRSGLVIITILGVSLFWYNQLGKVSIKSHLLAAIEATFVKVKENNKEVMSDGGEEARVIQDVLAKPHELADEIYNLLPSIIFIFSFLGLWVSLYMTLRNSLIWRYKNLYQFSLRDLIHFRAPDFFVYPLIVSLVLLVSADYGLGKTASIVGGNLLYCLGVFYLFQGFGVYSDFLKYLRIRGFIKTLFIVFTLVMAFKFLAIIGMFDLWFDFRKYLQNKENSNDKGDIK